MKLTRQQRNAIRMQAVKAGAIPDESLTPGNDAWRMFSIATGHASSPNACAIVYRAPKFRFIRQAIDLLRRHGAEVLILFNVANESFAPASARAFVISKEELFAADTNFERMFRTETYRRHGYINNNDFEIWAGKFII